MSVMNNLRRWRIRSRANHAKMLHNEWKEADARVREMRRLFEAKKRTPRTEQEISRDEVALAKASLKARRAKQDMTEYRIRCEKRDKRRMARKTRRKEAWTTIRNRWLTLWRGFRAALAEQRAQIHLEMRAASGEGAFRKIRVAQIAISGYAVLGVNVLFSSVSAVLEGSLGTLATSGSWLLQCISDALPLLWSELLGAVNRTVHWVLYGTLVLISSILEGVVLILSWIAMAVASPFVGLSRVFTRGTAKGESSPTPAPPVDAPNTPFDHPTVVTV